MTRMRYNTGNCEKGVNVFIYSSSLLLFIVGLLKLISMTGRARILQELDPLIGIRYEHLFAFAGSVETIVALVGVFSKSLFVRALLISWIATVISTYRFGLIWIGYHGVCGCLGSLTEALHIPARTSDAVLKAVLLYLLIGGYATLLVLWRQRNRPSILVPTQ